MLDERPQTFEATVTRAKLGNRKPLYAAAPLALLVALSYFVHVHVVLWCGVGAVAFLGLILAAFWPGRASTKLHATKDALHVANTTIPRADVASGFVGGEEVVLLDEKGRTVDSFTFQRGGAAQFLSFWKLDAKVAALEVEVASPFKDSVLLVCGFFAVVASGVMLRWLSFPATCAATAIYGAVWWQLVAARTRVRVGHDGVTVRFLGRLRFIPFRDIVAAAILPDGLHIELSRGKAIRLRGAAEDPVLVAILERIQAARNGRETIEPIAALDRLVHAGDEAWLEHVRQLALTSYRAQAFDTERLWAVCEDGHQPEAARAAAAYVLRLRLPDPQTTKRIRVSAGTAAHPQLRVAMGEIADAAPEALDQALLGVLHTRPQP